MNIQIECIKYVEFSTNLVDLTLSIEEKLYLQKNHPNDFKDYIVTSDNFTLQESKAIYNQDGSFSHVLVDANIFQKNDPQIRTKIKNKIQKIINNTYKIIENGQSIKLDTKFSKEFVYSESSKRLKHRKITEKGKLIDAIDLLINYASDKEYEKAKHKHHKNDAAFGFYKYKVCYEIEGENNIKTATLLIRNDKNKQKYIYDIFI